VLHGVCSAGLHARRRWCYPANAGAARLGEDRDAADAGNIEDRLHQFGTGGSGFFHARVDIVYAHAGQDRALIDAAVRAGARGLVLAGVGDGNLSAPALAACAAAAKKGVAIVRASRTGGGVVERNIEVDDDRHGFIAADELNPQKARVLLQLALTRTRDVRALQEMFFAY